MHRFACVSGIVYCVMCPFYARLRYAFRSRKEAFINALLAPRHVTAFQSEVLFSEKGLAVGLEVVRIMCARDLFWMP